MANTLLYSNNAETLLATSINAAATSIVGTSCSAFPNPGSGEIFYATLTDGIQAPEIVKVTARSTNTLTVVRAQEGTTAVAWTATATTISVRITAASLSQFAQGALNSGNAKGAGAIDYQTGRSAATQVASGANSIAIGVNNTASGSTAIAIGIGTTVAGANSIGVGNTATCAGSDSVAIGETTTAAGNTGTAMGYAASAGGTNSTAIGRGSSASTSQCTSIGYNAATSAADATAVGSGATASKSGATAIGKGAVANTQDDTTAVGSGAAASNYFALALGYSASATGIRAISLGNSSASATDSTAIGEVATASGSGALAVGNSATASGSGSIAIGPSSLSRRDNSSNINSTRILAIDNWWTQSEYGFNCTNEETLFSSYIDLTGGSTWATATSYNHGHVVKPTTPNGYQYWLWTSNLGSITTAGAEPTWPTSHGGSVAAGSGAYWICIDAANYVVTLPTGVKFFPTAVGFITEKYNTVTVQPNISFGESGNLTKFLASTTTTNLTAAYSIEKYTTLASYVGGSSVAFKLQTAATGTQLLGRAFWRGYFVDVVT